MQGKEPKVSERPMASVARSSSGREDPRALLATCVAAAVRASEVVRRGAADLRAVHWEVKGPADFVSAVDRGAEEVIAQVVAERHPTAALTAAELTFVADPLDGTTNFLHGFPWYAVSIGAVVAGETVAGAVLNVANGDLFTAAQGSGARKNGEAIRVSEITEPARALVGTGF